MTNLSRTEINARIHATIQNNIDTTGIHIMGVIENPPFYYSIGMLPDFGFEIFNMGLPFEAAFPVYNVIYQELRNGLKIELGKAYSMENTDWALNRIKFVKVDHPLLFDKWMYRAREWWHKEFPVYQLVLSDVNGLLPGEEDFDHDYMDQVQQILVAKR